MFSDLEEIINREMFEMGLDFTDPADVNFFWAGKL